ncbi:hypothetical protein Dimus_009945 [Dionaea muscipula]
MTIGKASVLVEEASAARFYKIILSWDYVRLLKDSKIDGADSGLREVKNTYEDVEDYLSTYEPLLFEEVKAQIIQEYSDEHGISVAKQQMVLLDGYDERDSFSFTGVFYNSDEGESISQQDLLLVSKEKFGSGTRLPSAYALALVEHRQNFQNRLSIRMFLGGEVQGINMDDIKPCDRLSNMLEHLLMRKQLSEQPHTLYITKVCSLSTIYREYVALRSISSLPFKDLILKAADNNTNTDHAWNIRPRLMEYIESSHNKSQLEAIRAGLSRKPFVLIQGPPGTGKTQTIIGILSAILHATPARLHGSNQMSDVRQRLKFSMEEKYLLWVKASPWLKGANPRDVNMPVNGDDGFFPVTGNDLKPEVVSCSRKYRVRVLVCAPSNSALDEIVLRVLHQGVHDENDRVYHPKIVRIGLKPHHSVQAVSMDYLVEQKRAGMVEQKLGASREDTDSIRAAILDESVIVFSTLSFSGSTIFTKLSRGFDVVVIDEAAQAVESSTLVPLINGCKQVFLVGDPVQLPATVISSKAKDKRYGMSLFERFQRAGYPVVMLDTQYRMHPSISSFPSMEFYGGKLENGPDVEEQAKRLWHDYRCFGPFCFFDIHEGEESKPPGSGSWINVDEVEFVLLLYQKLVDKYPELKSSSRLAIISPYRQQVKLFRERFQEIFAIEPEKVVDINTVDGFQGREKDVAIFSCVRANEDGVIGFVKDYQRMNVGITRAKSSVLVVGSASTLKKENQHWHNLIAHAEKNERLLKVSKPYASFCSDENLESMKEKGMDEPMIEMDNVYGDPTNVEEAPQEEDMEEGDYGYDMGNEDGD